MLIVFDTNIFVADFWMKGVAFQVLLSGLGRMAAKPRVPAIVVAEVVNKFDETLRKKWDAAVSAGHALNRLADEDLQRPPSLQDKGRLVEKFASQFARQLSASGFEVLDYPAVDHKTVAARALAKRRPFSAKGTGYRDTLIWESVLALASGGSSRIVLVSNNTNDFADSDGKLHADLESDLAERGIAPGRVSLVTSLDELNARHVVPSLNKLDGVLAKLRDGTYTQFNLRNWIEKNFSALVHDDDVKMVAHGLPPDCGGAVVDLKAIKRADVEDVRELPTGGLLVIANAAAVVTSLLSLSSDDYERYAEAREILGASDEKGAWDSSFESEDEIVFKFHLILGADDLVTDYELKEVSGERETIGLVSVLALRGYPHAPVTR